MNTQGLRSNQRMLALILGVAVIATVGGSLAYAQTSTQQGQAPAPIQGSVNVPQMILSSVKTGFTDAANTAAGQVSGGKVLAGALTIQQGYAVYAFKVTNGTSVYSVIVDAGNGQVLKTSQGHPLGSISAFGGFGGQGMRGHSHFGMHAGAWKGQQGTTTQSGYQE